jgi:hypothetical protein
MYTITYIRAGMIRAITTPSLSVFIDTIHALRIAGRRPRGWDKSGHMLAH